MSGLSKDAIKTKLSDALNSFLAQNKALTHSGVQHKPTETMDSPIVVEDCLKSNKFQLLFQIIPLILKHSDRKSIGSYSGKHVVEKLLTPSYISNGEFILALVALGYKYKIKKDSLNVQFYGCWTDPPLYDEVKYPFEIKPIE